MVPGRDTLFTNNTCLRVYKSTPVQGLKRLQILFLYHLSQYVRLRAWTKERWNLWTYVIRDNCFRLSISYNEFEQFLFSVLKNMVSPIGF